MYTFKIKYKILYLWVYNLVPKSDHQSRTFPHVDSSRTDQAGLPGAFTFCMQPAASTRKPSIDKSSMPPWVAALPRSTLLRTGRIIGKVQPALKCSCRTLTGHSPTTFPRSSASFPRLPAARRIRYASTIVSPTTINLRPNIPPESKELYNALKTLRWAAKDYVNASRVDLALQGLTAQDAVTRVAGRIYTSKAREIHGN